MGPKIRVRNSSGRCHWFIFFRKETKLTWCSAKLTIASRSQITGIGKFQWAWQDPAYCLCPLLMCCLSSKCHRESGSQEALQCKVFVPETWYSFVDIAQKQSQCDDCHGNEKILLCFSPDRWLLCHEAIHILLLPCS